MKVSELTNSDYLASDDYTVGQTFPLLTITKVEPKTPPSGGKKRRAVIHLEKAPKPWMVSSNQVLRELAKAFGDADIETKWVGCKVALVVVGKVRRPNGTVGNAFRIHQLEPKNPNQGTPA